MNIKPFLTLASERLAGTPTCCEEKLRAPAESTSREEKPRVPIEERDQVLSPR